MYRGKLNNKCSKDQGRGEGGFHVCPRTTSDIEYKSIFYPLPEPGVAMSPSLWPPSAITYDGKGLSCGDDLNGLWFLDVLFETEIRRDAYQGG